MTIGIAIADEDSHDWMDIALGSLHGVKTSRFGISETPPTFDLRLILADGDRPGIHFFRHLEMFIKEDRVPWLMVLGSPESPLIRNMDWENLEVTFVRKPYIVEDVKRTVSILLEKIVTMPKASDPLPKTEKKSLGYLSTIQLADLIQMLCMSAWSGKIDAENLMTGERGVLHIDSGNIIHASSCDLPGEDACFEMLSWPRCKFDFYEDLPPAPKNVGLPWQEILLEGARRLDTCRAGQNEFVSVIG